MKIYIVQSEYGDYECSYTSPIKGFLKREKAIEFMEDIELRSIILRDELKKIWDEKEKERRRIDTMNIVRGSEEWVEKLLELNRIYNEKEEQLIKESGLGDNFISNIENEGIGIEEIEVDESE